ncbi:MAG: hypothetical protein SPK27_02265, partial [Sodaliphilus sp.]|nr:hypothetical protein [Bacteroidales bacterium]MDY5866995.1 hypothetical protein [Sodaliphilus sp.]
MYEKVYFGTKIATFIGASKCFGWKIDLIGLFKVNVFWGGMIKVATQKKCDLYFLYALPLGGWGDYSAGVHLQRTGETMAPSSL